MVAGMLMAIGFLSSACVIEAARPADRTGGSVMIVSLFIYRTTKK
jgi:hypothetical protein